MCHNVARHSYCSTACYIQRMESPLHSGFVGRLPVTLEKRSPINNPLHSEIESGAIWLIDSGTMRNLGNHLDL